MSSGARSATGRKHTNLAWLPWLLLALLVALIIAVVLIVAAVNDDDSDAASIPDRNATSTFVNPGVAPILNFQHNEMEQSS